MMQNVFSMGNLIHSKPLLRQIDGLLLLDKPIGISSNQALQRVKRLYQAKKAGHTGSLDVLASGMLPICFGKATKQANDFLCADKTYLVTARLGIKTESGDAESKIISEKPVDISDVQLDLVLNQFRGNISQIPSMFSALKRNGQPLYKLARKGITVERAPRQIMIYELNILDRKDQDLYFFVRCSKGTYIRSLIDDIGDALGCGAYVSALRRTTVGNFLESKMVTLPFIEALAKENNFEALQALLIDLQAI